MNRDIAPGVMCIVIRSQAGNQGREVVALRQVSKGERVAEAGLLTHAGQDGWLVKANYPLNAIRPRQGIDYHFGIFPSTWLLPLHPGNEPDATENVAPIKTDIPSLTPS